MLRAQFFPVRDDTRAKNRKVVDHFLVICHHEFPNVIDTLSAANTSQNQPTENEVPTAVKPRHGLRRERERKN